MAKESLNDLSLSYINERGKVVSGTAATLHTIKIVGGLRYYNQMVGRAYVDMFLDSLSPAVNATIEAEVKRKRFRVVG